MEDNSYGVSTNGPGTGAGENSESGSSESESMSGEEEMSDSNTGDGDGDGDSSGDGDGDPPGDGDGDPPAGPLAPAPTLNVAAIKQFELSWEPALGATSYRVWERLGPGEPLVQLAEVEDNGYTFHVPLHARLNASYVVEACNEWGCTGSASVDVTGDLAEAVGYLKASNTDATDVDENDLFGFAAALSDDGRTLAVGALYEDGGGGIEGDEGDNSVSKAGAVYVFVRDDGGGWVQEAYIKASNPSVLDDFGDSVALSANGDTLVVGARLEDDAGLDAGAIYVFVRAQGEWTQQALLRADNPSPGDRFGFGVALSDDGDTVVVGAPNEDSSATAVDGDGSDNAAANAGAGYVFMRDNQGVWTQGAYLKATTASANDGMGSMVAMSADGSVVAVAAPGKDLDGLVDAGCVHVFARDEQGTWMQQHTLTASNAGATDAFSAGFGLAMSADGRTIAVGAAGEDSGATGVGGSQGDNSTSDAGAAYVFIRNGEGAWSQDAYIKASNTGAQDRFGHSIALSADGRGLAIGALGEASDAVGVGGDEANELAPDAGAVYVFVRDEQGPWAQTAYLKASNTAPTDWFGYSLSMSADMFVIAVGAVWEDSNATGIGGTQDNDAAPGAGAVYLF